MDQSQYDDANRDLDMPEEIRYGAGRLTNADRVRIMRAGIPDHAVIGIDAQGRLRVSLPKPHELERVAPYRADLYDKNPDEMLEQMAREDEEHFDGNYDRLMREVPGGFTPGGSRSSKSNTKKPPPAADRSKASIVDMEMPTVRRPHVVSGRVSRAAYNALRARDTGDIFEQVGMALDAGVQWSTLRETLHQMEIKARETQLREVS